MRWATLPEWLAWQETLHPKAIDLRLERLQAVWGRLGPPRLPGALVTVGGTNGKGSTVAYLESCLRAAGVKTGVYTSPHLMRYNERIRIDGQEVSDSQLCEAFDRIDSARGEISLTYFEFGTLAALDLFSAAATRVMVLEVGLGGRLDAVNMLDADVAVVTSIGLDHMAYLGTDLNQIAFEKAGIFRANRPAIIGSRTAVPRLREQAETLGAQVLQLGRDYDWRLTVDSDQAVEWCWRHQDGAEIVGLPLPQLQGTVQLENASAALAALHALPRVRRDVPPVSVDALRAGVGAATLAGRFQIVPGQPCWILDVAHNQDAMRVLVANLRGLSPMGNLHLVFSVLADKEAVALAGILAPIVDYWYLAEAPGPRGMPLAALTAAVSAAGIESPMACDNLDEAFRLAEKAATPADGILVTGSFVTVEAGLRYRLGRR